MKRQWPQRQILSQRQLLIHSLHSDPPYIPADFFFSSPGASLDEREIQKLRAVLKSKYDYDPVEYKRVLSAAEDYPQLINHPPYQPIRFAELRIFKGYARQLGQELDGAVLVDLGCYDGSKMEYLLKVTAPYGKPAGVIGVDVIGDHLKSYEKRIRPHVLFPEAAKTICGNMFNDKLWKGIHQEFDVIRSKLTSRPRLIFGFFGLTNGNISDQDYKSLFSHPAPMLESGDQFWTGNNMMGTKSRPDIEKDIQAIEAAYNAPPVRPRIHMVTHLAFKVMGCVPPDHREGTAIVAFNRDTTTLERKIEFSSPQYLRFFLEAGHNAFAGGRTQKPIKTIYLPGSKTRSVDDINRAGGPNWPVVCSHLDPWDLTGVALHRSEFTRNRLTLG